LRACDREALFKYEGGFTFWQSTEARFIAWVEGVSTTESRRKFGKS
jgi:hypothetical protein